MKMSEFEKIADNAVKALPKFFRDRMSNVIITAVYAPPPRLGGRGNKNLLGLYEGIPLSERGIFYSGVLPDTITLFKRNIELSAKTSGDITAQITHTLRHELAHHFGFTDEELLRKGLY